LPVVTLVSLATGHEGGGGGCSLKIMGELEALVLSGLLSWFKRKLTLLRNSN